MRGKKYLLILSIALLFNAVMVHVPVHALPSGSVRVYVDMSDSYIPGKSVGTKFDIDICIESPPEWDNTTDGIIAWTIYVKVDPDVLQPLTVRGASSGYFLYNFTEYYEYYENAPNLLFTLNKTEGLFSDVTESIMGWGPLGVGAGGSGKLCTLKVKSLNETAYSLIDIFEAYYYTQPDGEQFPVDIVDDGHYNQPAAVEPPVADFTYLPSAPAVGETVTFNATASYDPDGTIVSYLWDFGDETNGTGEITTHIYASAGSYLVNLTVTDNDGLNGTTAKTVTVSDILPPAWSNAGTNNTIAGQPTLFHVKWTDNVGLSGFIFGTNNTGTWTNNTWTPMSGTTDWSNITKTLSSTVDIVVQWRVWANDTSNNWNDTGILSLTTAPSMVVHDVVVDSVAPSATEVHFRQLVNINVTVKNNGTTAETFNVTVYYDNTPIRNQTVHNLSPHENTTIHFTWDTADALKGTYIIKAEASVVPGETNTTNNVLTNGAVTIKITDANGDERVYTEDLEMLREAYGTVSGEPNYDPNVDFNGDGKVNYKDLFLLACNWGYGVPEE